MPSEMASEIADVAVKVMPTAISAQLAGAAAPGGQLFEALEPILRRHHRSPDSLIEILNQSQELYRHLSDICCAMSPAAWSCRSAASMPRPASITCSVFARRRGTAASSATARPVR